MSNYPTTIMGVQQMIKAGTDENSSCLSGHMEKAIAGLGFDPAKIESTYYGDVGGPMAYHWCRAIGEASAERSVLALAGIEETCGHQFTAYERKTASRLVRAGLLLSARKAGCSMRHYRPTN